MSFVPNSFLYDGFTYGDPHQVGPIRPWSDPVTKGGGYDLTLRIGALAWAATPIDAGGPEGGWLVGESKPRDIGSGLLEWDQSYMYLPPSRTVAESISYPDQLIVTNNGQRSLAEIALTTTASVQYDYWHTSDPSIIPILRAYRLTQVGQQLWYVGTPPDEDTTVIIAADSSVRVLRGIIYERKTPYVTRAGLLQSNP